MKARVFLPILLVGVTSIFVRAAHLEPLSVMTEGNCRSYAFDDTQSDPADDPGTTWRDYHIVRDTDTAQDLASSSVVSTAQASADLEFINDSTPQQVHLTAIIDINGQTTAAASGFSALADFSTRHFGSDTNGLFYQVVGDGEPAGTPVTIDLSYLIQASNNTTNGWIEFSYPLGAGGLLVAINSSPSSNYPSQDSVIYRGAYLTIPSGYTVSDNDRATFVAEVGDTIAIYWGAYAGWTYSSDVSVNGAISGQMDVNLQVVNGRTNTADINDDKIINMADMALLAENWLWEATVPVPTNPADINEDESVNPLDLTLLTESWLWEAAPISNQTCDNAMLVMPGIVYEENMANTEAGELWYRTRPMEEGRYIVSLCGSDFDTRLTQYEQSGVCPGAYITENDDTCGQQSQLVTDICAYTDTFFRIDSPTGQSGTMRLELTRLPRPENDDQYSATEAQLDTAYSGSTIGSVGDMSVWYTFTPAMDDFYTISLCGSSFDTTLGVNAMDWTGWWYNDNACDLASELIAYLTAGTIYQIEVGGYDRGDYQLLITQGAAAPLNDDCTQAETVYTWQSVSGTTMAATGSDISSCMDGDEQDVWYRFMPDSNPVYTFSLSTYGAEKTVSVYSATDCPGYEYACEQTSGGWIEFPLVLTAGEEVLIRVGSSAADAGEFSLYVY